MDINGTKTIDTLNLVTEKEILNDKKDYSFDIKSLKKEKIEVKPRDPRKKLFIVRKEEIDLIIPQFVYDKNSIGEPPEKEVTFSNLNDNVGKKNLEDMCRLCGQVEKIEILYHPKTSRHLGLAKVVFRSSRSAKNCVEKYHNTSKMGNIMNVQIDVLGKFCKEMYNNIVNPPAISNPEVDTNEKPSAQWGYYPSEMPQNNFVMSSDDVVKSSQSLTGSLVKAETHLGDTTNQQNNEIDSGSEYNSDDSNGQKYVHSNSVVSSSIDPSRMVASSLTNEPLEPLELRIAKLLTGTSLCAETKPKPITDNNDISSSTEPFHYEEAFTPSTYNNAVNIKTESRRHPEEKQSIDQNAQKCDDNRPSRSRHSSKSSLSYQTPQRVLILKTPPKKLTDREIEEILEKLRNQFIDDLKETLHRDICKKMIETTAYGSFHNWWDFKEHEHKSTVGDKMETSEPVNISSQQKNTFNSSENLSSIRYGEKINVFQSQLTNYTGLPKIKRLPRQTSPSEDNSYYHSRLSPKSDKKSSHWSHRDSYSKHRSDRSSTNRDYYRSKKDGYHHRYDKYRDHHHHNRDDYRREDRLSPRPMKKRYEKTDGFVSETDDSDLGANSRNNRDVHVKDSKKDETAVNSYDENNFTKDKSKETKNLKPTARKIWQSSDDDDDTDKTETMAAKDSLLRKSQSEKKRKSDNLSDTDSFADNKTEKQENKAIINKKSIDVKTEKKDVLNKVETKVVKRGRPPKQTVLEKSKIEPKMKKHKFSCEKSELTSGGSISDDEAEEEDDGDDEEEEELESEESDNRTPSSSSTFSKRKVYKNRQRKRNRKLVVHRSNNKISDDDQSSISQCVKSKKTKRQLDEDYWDSCSNVTKKYKVNDSLQIINTKHAAQQLDNLTYESELYFQDLSYWNTFDENPDQHYSSLGYNLLTNQQKVFSSQSSNRFSSLVPSRRKQNLIPYGKENSSIQNPVKSISRLISDSRSHSNSAEVADSTDSADTESVTLENFIDGPYQWDEIIMHDHDYFQFPQIGTSISYKAKISKSQSKLHKLHSMEKQDTKSTTVDNTSTKQSLNNAINKSSLNLINEGPQSDSLSPNVKVLNEIFTNGVDAEDMHYFHLAYKKIISSQEDRQSQFDSEMLNNPIASISTLNWVDFPCTRLPPPSELKYFVTFNTERIEISDRPLSRKRIYDNCITDITNDKKISKKRRKLKDGVNFIEDPTDIVTIHSTGSARTQGYYQVNSHEKRMAAHGTMLLGNSKNTRMPLVPANH